MFFGARPFDLGLPPLSFFLVEYTIPYNPLKKGVFLDSSYLLPSLESSPSAEIYLGWSEKGVTVEVDSFLEADVELFLDTRDQKEAVLPTRFCHHFLFTTGGEGKEVTKLRIEEARPLCDARELFIKAEKEQKKRKLLIFIPAHCLHGYDPANFNRLGFAYRLRTGEEPFFNLEQRPAQWASCRLQ